MRRVGLALVVLTAVVATSNPAASETSVQESVWRAAGVTAARPAPGPRLTLSAVAGHPVSLEQFRGQIVMLYFWATW